MAPFLNIMMMVLSRVFCEMNWGKARVRRPLWERFGVRENVCSEPEVDDDEWKIQDGTYEPFLYFSYHGQCH